MIWEKITECCNLVGASLDGTYGWFWDIVTLCAIVLVFNFFFKRLLIYLESYFKKRNHAWQESFCGALYVPLSYYIWYFAFIELGDFFLFQALNRDFVNKALFIAGGLVVAFSWFLLRWKNKAIKALNLKHRFNSARLDVLDKVITVTVMIIMLLMLLEITGSSLNTLIAFGGISGLALAFASQEVIASFFGGLMIYINQPFQIGDWVLLPERSIEGHIEEIGWYTTRVRTFDKRPIYVPNSIFSKVVVINPSRMTHRQIKEIIGIRYRDMIVLKEIVSDIKKMIDEDPEVDHTMSSGAYFTAFGDYSLDILFSCYILETSTSGFNRIKEKVLFAIMEILKKHNAELAYPTTCVERSDDSIRIERPERDLDAGGVRV